MAVGTAVAAAPVRVIFDTDMAGDVDDVGALAILHVLADKGEAEIVACMVSAPNEFSGPCIDAINTWYGRPDIPIGNVRGFHDHYPAPGPATAADESIPSRYTEAVAKAFPHDLQRSSDAPDATVLYRRLLAGAADHEITIVSVGFLTNLRNLLDSTKDGVSDLPGEALVSRKVRQWVCMGGRFPEGRFDDGNGEYNVATDTAASVRAINDWPTPVLFSGFEIGSRIFTGEALRRTPAGNPVRSAYQHYTGGKSRESWDLTAVLAAVRGPEDYWTVSRPGQCLMHAGVARGYNEWIPSATHRQRYLVEKMPPARLGRILDELLTTPPGHP